MTGPGTQPSSGARALPGARDETGADEARETAARRLMLSPEIAGPLAETFRALGDTTRVRMLGALLSGERCVSDLATGLGLSESAVSHQLRLLRNLRVVRPRRAGRLVYYALDDQHIVRLFEQGLRHVEEMMPSAGLVADPVARTDTRQARRPSRPAGRRA